MTQPTTCCSYCGRRMNVGAAFCPACGRPKTSQPFAVPQPSASAKVKRKPSIVLILIGLLLVLFAVRIPIAQLFGISTTGVITKVEQNIDSSSDRMDYNYTVSFMFTTMDGKTQTGSYTLNEVYNSTALPNEGTPLPIRFLPGMPFVNFVDNQDDIGLSMIVTLILGVVIIVLGAAGVIRTGSRQR